MPTVIKDIHADLQTRETWERVVPVFAEDTVEFHVYLQNAYGKKKSLVDPTGMTAHAMVITSGGTICAEQATWTVATDADSNKYLKGSLNMDTFTTAGAVANASYGVPVAGFFEIEITDGSAITTVQCAVNIFKEAVVDGASSPVIVERFPNPLQFGADRTGATSSQVAFASVISNTTAGGTIFVPRGTYIVSSLEVDKSLTFLGEPGTVIKHAVDATDSLFKTDTGGGVVKLEFQNIELNGNQAARIAADATVQNSAVKLGALIYLGNGFKKLKCHNVIFRDAVRASISTHCAVKLSSCDFIGGPLHNGTLGGNCIHVYGEPIDSQRCELTVTDCDFTADSIDDATLHKNPGGIFVSEKSDGTNQYERIIVKGCRSYGIGTDAYTNHVGFLDTYNGAKKVIASGNHVEYCSNAAFKIQRCDDAIIVNNTIEHSRNPSADAPNTTTAIYYSPHDREGSSPFTGARANEHHYNAIITGNIIKGCKHTGIRFSGSNVLVHGNIIEDITPSGAGVVRGILGFTGSFNIQHVVISKNHIRKVPQEAIVVGSTTSASGLYKGVRILDNIIWQDGVTSTGGLIKMVGNSTTDALDCEVSGNQVYDETGGAGTAIQVDRCDRVVFRNNQAHKSAVGFLLSTECLDVEMSDNIAVSCVLGFSISGASDRVSLSHNRAFNCTSDYSATTSGLIIRRHFNSWDNELYFGQLNRSIRSDNSDPVTLALARNPGCLFLPSAAKAITVNAVEYTYNGIYFKGDFTTSTGWLFLGPKTPPIAVTTDISWHGQGTAAVFEATLTGNITFTFSNKFPGQKITVVVKNPSTYTVTWPTVRWKGGSAPTQTVNKTDIYHFYFDGTDVFGWVEQNF